MDFIYLFEIKKPLAIALSEWGSGTGRQKVGVI
jgi:hypothetical protein